MKGYLHWVVIVPLLAVFWLWGYSTSAKLITTDCTTLNQTIINGQHILCKPYNLNPNRVMR